MMDETQETPPTEEAEQPQRGGGLLKKLMVLGALVIVSGSLFWQFGDAIDLQKLAAQENKIVDAAKQNPAIVLGIAFLIYVTVTALSLPAATIITMGIGLLCHQVFGELAGLVIAVAVVSCASTSGATLAFLMSRYLLRDSIQNKFGDRLKKFNEALQREGAFYLFSLRLIPVVPFFVINLVMGLTPIRVRTFWWVSQLGMLAGTAVYVYAGTQLPSLQDLVEHGAGGVLNAQLFIAFTILGLFPLVVKKIMARVRPVTPESIV